MDGGGWWGDMSVCIDVYMYGAAKISRLGCNRETE